MDSPCYLSQMLILSFLLSFFVIWLTYSQRAPRYARPHENSINTAGRKGGIFWSKCRDRACRHVFHAEPRSLGLRPGSPLFLGTQRWTCAANGRRFTNQTELFRFLSGQGDLYLVLAPFRQLQDRFHNEGVGARSWCLCDFRPSKPPKNCLHKTANHTVKSSQTPSYSL